MRTLSIITIFLLFGCQKGDNLSFVENTNFMVETYVYSGWCAQDYHIVITEEQTKVEKLKKGNCAKEKGGLEGLFVTDSMKFDRLRELLRKVNFKEISISECFTCADGTDFNIILTENGKKYENRIGKTYNDSETLETKKDQQELLSVLESFLRE
ncbi:hypothetical protein [Sphingobacterium bovistauri]|uniref:Lipoprotein n=1 Tax=Sphingobacterium bovistauri TaxID=2781959 RepID=A0ABS7Z8R2_9SPHI|nr:hypothetical protein [Sphingobacterium bovistauri]MCA5006585.1 hypothetical protein [Sphingobacterium bovistauri]